MSGFEHIPVMLDECLEALDIRPDGVYVDMTLGLGGHSLEICKRLSMGRLIAFDRDEQAIERAKVKLDPYLDKITFIHSDYRMITERLGELGIGQIDGILCDMGVSSMQLDDAERGFSYQHEAPLDMRMDRSAGLTADEIVNTYPVNELASILKNYGEERYASRVASAIEKARPIKSTAEFAEVIIKAMPAAARREKQHPARRSFQGIRIAVNDEINGVSEGIKAAIDMLAPGGRLAVITFHSLEDRPVKHIFQEAASPCICPSDFPACVCGRKPAVKLHGKQPKIPCEEELKRNGRSHSAKLRTVEKI